MEKKVVFKAPGGKLLRINCVLDGSVIKRIKITGDFFIYPEEAISEIEQFLTGQRIDTIESALTKFLSNNSITIIGFKPADLFMALSDGAE